MSFKGIHDGMMAAYAEDAVDYTRSKFGIALDYTNESVEHVVRSHRGRGPHWVDSTRSSEVKPVAG